MDAEVFLALGTGLKWLGWALLPLFLLPLLILAAPRPLAGVGTWLSRKIDRLTEGVLMAAVASAILLIFTQLAVVLMRYVFSLSFTWLNEIVMYAFAAMFMFGSAVALRDDAHVRVDILRPRFGAAGRNWIELAGLYLFLFPICIRILDTGEQGLARAWSLFEGSRESDGLPLMFLFKTLVPAFAVLMLTQGLSEALKAALRLTGEMEDSAHTTELGGGHGA